VTILVSAGDSGVHAHGARCGCDENSGSGILHYSSDEQWSGSGYFPSFPATSPYGERHSGSCCDCGFVTLADDWIDHVCVFVVTAVGGTMGLNEGAEEVACQANAAGGIITTGSGFSTYFPTPSWQQQAVDGYFGESGTAAAAGYNQRGRGYPDISLTAVNYPVFINGDRYALYGTSASCPVMAAMVSLLNAERLLRNEPSIGWLNPTLYSAGYNVTLPNSTVAAFNDVTTGDSKCCSGPNPTEVLCCESGFIAAEGKTGAQVLRPVTVMSIFSLIVRFNVSSLFTRRLGSRYGMGLSQLPTVSRHLWVRCPGGGADQCWRGHHSVLTLEVAHSARRANRPGGGGFRPTHAPNVVGGIAKGFVQRFRNQVLFSTCTSTHNCATSRHLLYTRELLELCSHRISSHRGTRTTLVQKCTQLLPRALI
jgi:hypothetical protein